MRIRHTRLMILAQSQAIDFLHIFLLSVLDETETLNLLPA